MNPTEALPLLLVVVLLISASGADVDRMAVTFDGDHALETIDDVLVVAGGSTAVPPDGSVTGDIYVTGGSVRIEGDVDGDVTVLAGELAVADGATVSGTVQIIAGESTVSDGAAVAELTTFDPPPPPASPERRIGAFAMQFVLIGAAGWWLVRRRPLLIENVGHSISEHTLVSGVVGALAGATLLVLFVYMAFTLVLLPLSVVGLIVEVLIVLYGQVAFGQLIGRRLPVARAEIATVLGIGALLLFIEFLGAIPYLGTVVQFALVVVGFGAVINTYFGLQRFDPVRIPGGPD